MNKVELQALADEGYCTDEWSDWQEGGCGDYALALVALRPDLLIGSINEGSHFFAHDETHAYDSAGRHPLPYLGLWNRPIAPTRTMRLGISRTEMLKMWGGGRYHGAAIEHIRCHGILEGRYGARQEQALAQAATAG